MDRPEHEDQPAQRPAAEDAALLEENLRLIEDRSDRVINFFYATLFVESPHLRSLFPAAMDAQRDRLFRALIEAVRNIGDVESFVPMLAQLGRDHRKYGVHNEDYAGFGRALITSLERYSEDVWVPELEDAWVRVYRYLADTMIEGARQAAVTEPAWWRAEIIGHERRAEDIAVITVRPDRPYSYRAGQFASIETPYRPRSWRNYSMANAESADGLVEFHVRTVGAGFVSGPLVWSASPGDMLKLGAPTGEMAIDKQSQRNVVCIAGGTGLAPIKAMIDEMTRWNTAREVTLFFGVRRADDLYDMAALHRIAALNRWVTVVPCVSDDPSFVGERATLADVVARYGSWQDHDVFLCGSPDMTRATLSRLREIGVPDERIAFDVAEGMHPATAQVIDLRRTRAKRATQSLAPPLTRRRSSAPQLTTFGRPGVASTGWSSQGVVELKGSYGGVDQGGCEGFVVGGVGFVRGGCSAGCWPGGGRGGCGGCLGVCGKPFVRWGRGGGVIDQSGCSAPPAAIFFWPGGGEIVVGVAAGLTRGGPGRWSGRDPRRATR